MVDVREITPHCTPHGERRHGHVRIQTTYTPELFGQILNEANRRGWTFSAMVRHLCEASIEGIE